MIKLHELSPSLFPKSLAGLCKRDQELMCDAYRRSWLRRTPGNMMPQTDMMGLGTKTTYGKSKLFKTHDSKNYPRHDCWWDLTEKGVTVLKAMIEEVPYKGVM